MEKKTTNINAMISIAMFLMSMGGAIGGYHKSIYDIRKEITDEGKQIRFEIRENYATKEETRFIQAAIIEMKSDVKEIKRVILSREAYSLEEKIKKKAIGLYGEKEWASSGGSILYMIRTYGFNLEKAWKIVQDKKETNNGS